MMKSFTLIICYLMLGILHLNGQIIVDSMPHKLVLVDNEYVKVLRSDIKTPFKTIREQKNWTSYDSTFKPESKTAIWIKLEIQNKSKDTIIKYLFSNNHLTTIYLQKKNTLKKIINEDYEPLGRSKQSVDFFTKLKFLPYQDAQLYIKLYINKSNSKPNIPTLYSEREYIKFTENEYRNQANSIGFIYFYIISLLTISIFTLVFWLRLQNRIYLYYLGYLFFQIVYGFLTLGNTLAPFGSFFKSFPKTSFSLFEPVQFLFVGFYILFTTQLLQVKNYDKLLTKSLNYLAVFCIVFAISIFSFGYFFMEAKFTNILFLTIRVIILPINLILIFWIIYKVKHPLLIYFIIGQSFFFIGAIVSTYVSYSETHLIPGHFLNFKESPNIIFQLGLLIEVYCFSIALGKNFFVLQKEKEKANEDLIQQLQKNQDIQETMNLELDKKVNEKTSELLQLYSEIEREREQKTKDDFTKKIRETEMIALRSQMNPHFIFNSMSAIKNLIMTARNEDAVSYLDDFSSLLREILQNSNRDKITVEEELEILELYISLEQSRMGTSFKYNLHVQSREALSQYEIPPLLLQPIVENAIWHGLNPSLKTEKKLTIIFDTTNNLKIIIEDNGIGRKASAKNKKLHDSMGTTIVKDRLTLFNHLNKHNIQFEIIDLEEDDTALGTRIILTYDN